MTKIRTIAAWLVGGIGLAVALGAVTYFAVVTVKLHSGVPRYEFVSADGCPVKGWREAGTGGHWDVIVHCDQTNRIWQPYAGFFTLHPTKSDKFRTAAK